MLQLKTNFYSLKRTLKTLYHKEQAPFNEISLRPFYFLRTLPVWSLCLILIHEFYILVK